MCRACGTLPHSKARNHPKDRADAVGSATVRTPVEDAEGWDDVPAERRGDRVTVRRSMETRAVATVLLPMLSGSPGEHGSATDRPGRSCWAVMPRRPTGTTVRVRAGHRVCRWSYPPVRPKHG